MKKPIIFLTVACATFAEQSYMVWRDHLGGPESPQYSALSQINKTNVAQLQPVWFYPAGDNGFRYGFNPTVVDGLVYLLGPHNAVTAVDAAMGKLVSEHDLGDTKMSITHRG